MRQGNDVGSQYRSAIYPTTPSQLVLAQESREMYQRELANAGFHPITTEISNAGVFHYVEEYHQQYLAKNPDGYCGIGGTGVSCSIPSHVSEQSDSTSDSRWSSPSIGPDIIAVGVDRSTLPS